MNSIIFQNDSIFSSQKKKQKRSIIGSKPLKFLKIIEIKHTSWQKSYNNKFVKKNSMSNIKSIYYNNIFKKIRKINIKENKKDINTKSILPLLDSIWKQKNNLFPNYNSQINNIKNMNQFKEYNSKYLYLEYKKENSENELDNETKYIEIDPQQIILSLTEFPKIKQIFKNLTKKINKRNINSYSKINIDKIFTNLEKQRKNNQINNNKFDNTNSTIYYNNDLNNNSTLFLSEMEYKDNYSIQDLFLLDIINKVIKYAIFTNDNDKSFIDEEFMLKEYKTQIKKLKAFFDEKINGNKYCNLFNIIKETNKNENSQKEIQKGTIFHNNILSDYINNELIYKNRKYEEFFDENNKTKKKIDFNRTSYEKRYLSNNIDKKMKIIFNSRPKGNIYNFDIGQKINIIDFDELLNKLHRKRLDEKDDNTNMDENILKKILELNKNKITFENIMIEEKTKLLKNKSDLFMSQSSEYFSRNINNRKINRKQLCIRNELFNADVNKDNKKEKEIESSKKDIPIISKSNDSYSSINDSDYLKVISKKENNYNTGEKINIEKLEIKKDFGITKVGFNKTMDKIRKMHCNKTNKTKKIMKVNNFSFLNTIYGKINTKRKMKINEIDYKEEIRQKGLQLLYNIFKINPKLKLNKNISTGNICMSEKDNKSNHKTFNKRTSTRDILFN